MAINLNQISVALLYFACVFFFYKGFDTIFDDFKEKNYQSVLKFLFGLLFLFVASLDFYAMFMT